MAASVMNYVFLILSFITLIPAVGLIWRVFYSDDQLTGKVYRLANYEACGFVFFWVLCAVAVGFLKAGKTSTVVRATSIGVLVYVTIYGVFTNFNTLNNLRIIEQASTRSFYYPSSVAGGAIGPVTSNLQRKYLGGMILGYFSLFFGLLASNAAFSGENFKRGLTIALYIFGLLLCIPGVVVCWANTSIASYPPDPTDVSQTYPQYQLFLITTFALVQWFVLTLGLIGGAEDTVLLNASGFTYAIGNLFAPVAFFLIQWSNPGDADFLWAGPILCWIGGFVFALAAATANSVQKEAAV